MHLGEFFGPAEVSSSVPAASATSIELLSKNPDRRMVTVFNHSGAALFLKMGPTAAVTDFTVKLASGSFYEFSLPIHTGSVSGIWDAAAGHAMITTYSAPEFRFP